MSEDQTGLVAAELTKLIAAQGGRVIDEESLLAIFGKCYNGIRDISLQRVKHEQQAARSLSKDGEGEPTAVR